MSFYTFLEKNFEMKNKFLSNMMNLFQDFLLRVGSKYLALERWLDKWR